MVMSVAVWLCLGVVLLSLLLQDGVEGAGIDGTRSSSAGASGGLGAGA